MRGTLLFCFVAAVVIPARGWAWSTQGGEIVEPGKGAFSVATGYPYGLLAGHHIAVVRDFEVVPTFSFYYGMATSVPTVGNVFSAGLKFRVLNSGNFHLSIMAEPGFILNYHPGGFTFGLQLGLPQILATYAVASKFSLHFGFRMPIAIYFNPTVGAIPIAARFGMEYLVTSRVSVFAAMDLGALIFAAKSASTARFFPTFLFGSSFRF